MTYRKKYYSPIGTLTLESDGEALCAIRFTEEATESECGNLAVFDETEKWLDTYFSGRAPDFTPKISLCVSPFRKAVLDIVAKIPYGETKSYGIIAKEVAARLSKERMSAQAVGGAIGHNPVPIIIPCHRVIGSDRSLVGFSGGIDKKIKLLDHEKIEYNV